MLKRLFASSWYERLELIRSLCTALKTRLYYAPFFGAIGKGSRIATPLMIRNPHRIFIGDNTRIRRGARLETIVLDKSRPPSLVIGNNVNIEQNVHIVCSSRIVIGDRVSITGGCAIVDTKHPFRDVNDPRKIGERIDPSPTPVEIGANTFIGYGAVILPNVRIGRNCIIGANCTVAKSVPDFSVVACQPAAVILHYDQATEDWIP